jgi:hypothetical protein
MLLDGRSSGTIPESTAAELRGTRKVPIPGDAEVVRQPRSLLGNSLGEIRSAPRHQVMSAEADAPMTHSCR